MIKEKRGLIYLVSTNEEKTLLKTINIIKKLIKSKALCIYITFNKPAKVLKKTFNSKGVNINKILFIDAVTRLSEDVDIEKDIIYIDSPKDLTDLLIILRNSLEINAEKNKFVFIDSISNILNYNSNQETIKFIQSLTNKLRLIEVEGELLIIEGGLTQKSIVHEFKKYVDQVIQL